MFSQLEVGVSGKIQKSLQELELLKIMKRSLQTVAHPFFLLSFKKPINVQSMGADPEMRTPDPCLRQHVLSSRAHPRPLLASHIFLNDSRSRGNV